MKTLDLVHVVQLWALHCIPAQRSTPEPAQMGIKRKLKDGVRAFFTGVAAGLQNAHFEGRDARLHHAHTLKRHMERDRRMADFAERQLDAFAYPVQQHGPESHTWSSSPTSDLPANAQLIHHAGMAKHTVHPNRPQTTNFPQASATGSQHTPRSAPAFTVELCARDPERDQRLAQLEAQQPPLHSAWLHILQTSISELAGNKGSHKGGPLSVPWPWLVHDFLRLLPETSCYTILLDDPGIFSNLLQQVTDPDPDALSSAGAQTLAQIVSELAQKAPARLVNYAKTHNAILHRLKQVCSELLRHAAQGTDQSTKLQAAAQFYAQQLASSFLATPTADRKAQRNTLKLAMSIISLLPEHIQAVTHTQLLSPYNDMIQDYLRNKEFPDYMELAHVSLAVHFIESFLANPSLQPQVSANTISRWTVWSLQPASFETQPELQVRTAQLAVAACQLIHHSTANKSVSKRTLIDGFIDQVLAELQPRHLQARIDAWQGSNDEHVINLVRFSALLVNANLKQLDSSSETSCCNRQELVQQLKAAAATVNPKLVKSVLIKDMQSAIQQVKKNTPNKCVAATKHGVPEPSSQHLRHRHSQQSNEAQTPRHGSGQLPQPASQPADLNVATQNKAMSYASAVKGKDHGH